MRWSGSILRKGLLVIAVPLLFQVGFILLVARFRRESAAAEDWLIHSKEVMRHAEMPMVALAELHGRFRGYVLTREPAIAAEMREAHAELERSLSVLRQAVEDNPDQIETIRQIERKIGQLVGWMAGVEAMVDAGRQDEAVEMVKSLAGSRNIREIHSDFARFLGREERVGAGRQRRLERSRRQFDQLMVWGMALALSSSAFVAWIFGRGIGARIATLTDNAHRLAEGRELAPPIAGYDEIARLDRVFHEMAAVLGDATRKERAYRDLLEHRAEELAGVNRELEQQSRENEMFVYSVSHDLRSPLVNLQGFSRELASVGDDLRETLGREDVPEAVRARAAEVIDRDMGEAIHYIRAAVDRLGAIIDALLRLSRAGRVVYRLQVVDVSAVVARVVDALRGTIDERGARVEVGPLPPAWGDPTAIEQVFANLIGNALNYLDPARPGHIEVGALDDPPAGARADLDPEATRFYYVRDNGLGIPAAYLPKIFLAFQRLHKDLAPGEGIGLALVRRMAERLGGQIWAESTPSVGSTFYLALPAENPTPDDESEMSDEEDIEDSPALTQSIPEAIDRGLSR